MDLKQKCHELHGSYDVYHANEVFSVLSLTYMIMEWSTKQSIISIISMTMNDCQHMNESIHSKSNQARFQKYHILMRLLSLL